MKSVPPRFLALLLALSFPAFAAAETFKAATSILPHAGLVERIGGEKVEVSVLVGEGGNPHNYSPSAKQMVDLGSAKVLFVSGMPFEDALVRKFEGMKNGPTVVDLSKGMDLALWEDDHHDHDHDGHDHDHAEHAEHEHKHEEGEHKHEDQKEHAHEDHKHEEGEHKHDHDHKEHAHDDHDGHHDHDHGEFDPHVWLAPLLLEVQATKIATTLKEMDPDNAATYDANLKKLVADLYDLDFELAERLAPLKGGKIYVFHASFGYFAEAYGMKQVSVEMGGKSPSAKRVIELIEQAKEDKVKIIFVQPQFSQRSAKKIASEIGASVVPIDPLAKDVLANLREIGKAVASSQ